MKGFILTGLVAGMFAGTAAAELPYYSDIVDPCYPARYEWMAHQNVAAWFVPQVENGHVLDQTIWNIAGAFTIREYVSRTLMRPLR